MLSFLPSVFFSPLKATAASDKQSADLVNQRSNTNIDATTLDLLEHHITACKSDSPHQTSVFNEDSPLNTKASVKRKDDNDRQALCSPDLLSPARVNPKTAKSMPKNVSAVTKQLGSSLSF